MSRMLHGVYMTGGCLSASNVTAITTDLLQRGEEQDGSNGTKRETSKSGYGQGSETRLTLLFIVGLALGIELAYY